MFIPGNPSHSTRQYGIWTRARAPRSQGMGSADRVLVGVSCFVDPSAEDEKMQDDRKAFSHQSSEGRRVQSRRAIISSLGMGVKLSISSPLAARLARMCGGTSRWLSTGAMESSKLVSLGAQKETE
jgi:hypothetical protein